MKDLANRYLNKGDTNTYQPIEHPYFEGHTYTQPCVERWEMMLPFLSLPGTVLDIGCHTGWFCRRFAEINWKVTGVDTNKAAIDIALAMPCANIKYVHKNVMSCKLPQVDVALCLSTLMYVPAWRLLNKLSAVSPICFIDYGGMYSDKLPFNTEKDFIEGVTRFTLYKKCELLGHTSFQGRPFFKLNK